MMTALFTALSSKGFGEYLAFPLGIGCSPCDPIVIWLLRVVISFEAAILTTLLILLMSRMMSRIRLLGDLHSTVSMKGVNS